MGGIIGAIALKLIIIIIYIYDIITFPIYFIVQQYGKTTTSKAEKIVSENVGDSNFLTYISIKPDGPICDLIIKKNISTLDKLIQLATWHYGFRNCLGTRILIDEEIQEQSNGTASIKNAQANELDPLPSYPVQRKLCIPGRSNFLKLKCGFGPYQWKTYRDVKNEMEEFGRGMLMIGLKAKKPVIILSETREEWLITAFSCFGENIPLVTVYITMHQEGILYAVNKTDANTIITSYQVIPMLKLIIKKIPNLKNIIYFEHQISEPDLKDFPKSVTIYSYRKICTLGKNVKVEHNRPSPDDIAIIMFTSGTTGMPKGVIITHHNLIANIKAFTNHIKISPKDIMIGYLPLAHIFELACEIIVVVEGGSIGYSSPLTMVDGSGKLKNNTKGDIKVLQPSIMLATPLILERINKKIDEKISMLNGFTEQFMKFSISYKMFWYSKDFKTPILDRVVLKKIRQFLGGNLRLVLCGSAPLSPITQHQISMKICVTVIQGYGLTETTCCGLSQYEEDKEVGRVGYPLTGAYIHFDDLKTEETNNLPSGELVVGGEFVSPGYYNQETDSKDFFEVGGIRWFRTGDVALLHKDGSFEIIDRKKDIVKLQHGEYISLGRIEAALKTCQYIENICIHAKSDKNFAVAIVVPSKKFFEDLREMKGGTNVSDKESSSTMETAMIDAIRKQAKISNLTKYEIPALVIIAENDWTPETGMVTASMKLKRYDIYKKYKDQLASTYEKLTIFEKKISL